MCYLRFFVLIGLMCGAASISAREEGDPAIGRELAQEACARCHNVNSDGPFKLHPPSFAAIAVYRSEEQIFGRIVFPPLHAGMPQLGYILTPENVKHLVAYIQSLEAD